MIKIIILLFLIIILFNINKNKNKENLQINLMDFVKDNYGKFLLNNDNKLNLKIYYNSLDETNSKHYAPPITSISSDTSEKSLIFNKLKSLNKNIINIETHDTKTYNNNLDETFFQSLKSKTHKSKIHINGIEEDSLDVITKNLIVPNLLDKVPKIFLFFKKNDEDYIIMYEGNYNLDLKQDETYENIINFIEDTIKKYLLDNNIGCMSDDSYLIELNNRKYYKCSESIFFYEK